MNLKTILLLILFFVLVACSPAGGEPSLSDEPTQEATAVPSETDDPVAPEKMIEGEATVDAISIVILESFPVQVNVNVSGYLGDGCTTLGDITTNKEDNTFFVNITTKRPADAICTQQLVTFEEGILLDVEGLAAGIYTVNVNGVTDSFVLEVDNVLDLPGTDAGSLGSLDLPDEDKVALIRLTLERALVAQEIPDYALLAEQDPIVLSTANTDPALIPQLEGVNLVLMTPEEIQAKANAVGDFPYLQFQGFTAVSDTAVEVSLGSSMAVAADSEMIYLIGGGFTIAYEKTADGWQGEVITEWIS